MEEPEDRKKFCKMPCSGHGSHYIHDLTAAVVVCMGPAQGWVCQQPAMTQGEVHWGGGNREDLGVCIVCYEHGHANVQTHRNWWSLPWVSLRKMTGCPLFCVWMLTICVCIKCWSQVLSPRCLQPKTGLLQRLRTRISLTYFLRSSTDNEPAHSIQL